VISLSVIIAMQKVPNVSQDRLGVKKISQRKLSW